MMLYKSTKVKVRSLDEDADYALRTSIDFMIENGFTLAKERNQRYLTQTITDKVYADDISLLANTPAQAETLPH